MNLAPLEIDKLCVNAVAALACRRPDRDPIGA